MSKIRYLTDKNFIVVVSYHSSGFNSNKMEQKKLENRHKMLAKTKFKSKWRFPENPLALQKSDRENNNVENPKETTKSLPMDSSEDSSKMVFFKQKNKQPRQHCIISVNEKKSHEELRLEDYLANRKKTAGFFGQHSTISPMWFDLARDTAKTTFGFNMPLTGPPFGQFTVRNFQKQNPFIGNSVGNTSTAKKGTEIPLFGQKPIGIDRFDFGAQEPSKQKTHADTSLFGGQEPKPSTAVTLKFEQNKTVPPSFDFGTDQYKGSSFGLDQPFIFGEVKIPGLDTASKPATIERKPFNIRKTISKTLPDDEKSIVKSETKHPAPAQLANQENQDPLDAVKSNFFRFGQNEKDSLIEFNFGRNVSQTEKIGENVDQNDRPKEDLKIIEGSNDPKEEPVKMEEPKESLTQSQRDHDLKDDPTEQICKNSDEKDPSQDLEEKKESLNDQKEKSVEFEEPKGQEKNAWEDILETLKGYEEADFGKLDSPEDSSIASNSTFLGFSKEITEKILHFLIILIVVFVLNAVNKV